jgi:hypothetical protein
MNTIRWSKVMSSFDKTNFIQPLVDHIVAYEKDVNAWRKQLVATGAFTTEQVIALDDASLTLTYRTMLAVQFQAMGIERILAELEKHQVPWSVDFGDDHQNYAVCY